jgi:ATP-binding cassette subfamily C protein
VCKKIKLKNYLKKVWSLLSDYSVNQIGLMMAILFISALLELLGVGMLYPIVTLLQSPKLMPGLISNSTISKFNFSQETLLIFFLGVLLLVYFVKNIFIYCANKIQFNFFAKQQTALAQRLLKIYMGKPYTFHLEVNSSELIRTITSDVSAAFSYTLIPLMYLISEVLVLVLIFMLIVALYPGAAFFTLILAVIFVFGFYGIFHKKLAAISSGTQFHSGKVTQSIQESFGGIKEIIILGKEGFFQNIFYRHNQAYISHLASSNIHGVVPRLALEVVFISIFVGVLLMLLWDQKLSDALPILAVYAAAAFRVMPSINRIIASIGSLSLGRASLDVLSRELKEGASNETPIFLNSREFKNNILVNSVKYKYVGKELNVINGVSLEIKKGEMVGFIGPSGSGKSTLIDIILGLLVPREGNVFIDGVNINDCVDSWQRQIGYISQSVYLVDDSLRSNIAFGVPENDIDDSRIQYAVRAARLDTLVKSAPNGLGTLVGERGVRISGGERQRIGIARALYHDPAVLVLDEATSALDVMTEGEINDIIRELKGSKTILIIAHRFTTIQNCDRVYCMRDGQFEFEGSYDQAMLFHNAKKSQLSI